uniref:OSJNBa0083D01.4 protein n=1 Tax=Oryza sativa subsp. japonica TaxID=39947 RepID=Q7XVF4_ORYSJ|nr:OSJNBa0083D01.4 [Oryza sativa Japonica Group]
MAVRPRRRRRSAPPRAASHSEGDDRLSALPDELLLIVMRGLGTCSALGTDALSRRWARLPRELPALDFRVSDAHPRGYHQRAAEFLALLGGRGDDAAGRKLEASLARYERRVIRGLAESITGFLDAGAASEERRCVSRLTVEFFATNDAHRIGCVHRLINTAVGLWGVEELEVAIKPAPLNCPPGVDDAGRAHHSCPGGPAEVDAGFRLRPPLLLLGLPAPEEAPPQEMPLQGPRPGGGRATAIVGGGGGADHGARRRALLVPRHPAEPRRRAGRPGVCIHDANPVVVLFRDVPRLRRVHLSFSLDSSTVDDAQHPLPGPDKYKLDWHVRSERMASLVVRFTGPERWILPWRVSTRLRSLRRLLVADVPPTWDVSWPRLLLQAAPSLESLHVHVAATADDQPAAAAAPGREIMWPPAMFRHRKLGELVVACFGPTPGQVAFVSQKFLKLPINFGHPGIKSNFEIENPEGTVDDSGNRNCRMHLKSFDMVGSGLIELLHGLPHFLVLLKLSMQRGLLRKTGGMVMLSMSAIFLLLEELE